MKFISIVFPIHNEEKFVLKSLGAILAQDYSADQMQILVVDGMSNDRTRQVIHDLAASFPNHSVTIMDNPGRIVPTGMNIAICQAKGDIIIRVDGHTLIKPDYVRQCVEALERSNAQNVGGKMNAIGNNPFGKTVALATSSPFGVGGARFHYSDQEEWVDTVYMGAWPRKVFEMSGLFDEELVRDQDDEFNYRLREAGGKILLNPKIKSEYTVRGTPGSLWKQYYQYGYWKIRVLQKHPLQMSLRQFVPPLFVLGLIISILMAIFPSLRPFSLVIPGMYVLANLAASLWTAKRTGWQFTWLLPIVFAILHVSYGLGFLVGLFKFWNRWSDKKGKVPDFKGFPNQINPKTE